MYPLILKMEKFLVDFPHWQQTAGIFQLKSTWSLKVVIQSDSFPAGTNTCLSVSLSSDIQMVPSDVVWTKRQKLGALPDSLWDHFINTK